MAVSGDILFELRGDDLARTAPLSGEVYDDDALLTYGGIPFGLAVDVCDGHFDGCGAEGLVEAGIGSGQWSEGCGCE